MKKLAMGELDDPGRYSGSGTWLGTKTKQTEEEYSINDILKALQYLSEHDNNELQEEHNPNSEEKSAIRLFQVLVTKAAAFFQTVIKSISSQVSFT